VAKKNEPVETEITDEIDDADNVVEGFDDDGGDFLTLGKRRASWKPGKAPIEGILLGISGVRRTDHEIAQTYIIRVTKPTTVSDWDRDAKAETFRPSKPNEEVQVFVTTGLVDLRAYASLDVVHKVRISKGKKIKAGRGTFWDLNPIQVSRTGFKRTAADQIERGPSEAASAPPARPAPFPSTGATDSDIPF
jgi:hypothetical protein